MYRGIGITKQKRRLLLQPPTLEDMAIEKLAVWVAKQGTAVESTIEELYKHNATEAENTLSTHIEMIRDLLKCNVQRMLHDKLIAQTIEMLYYRHLSIIITDRRSKIDYNWEMGITANERMVETLFTKHVKSLSLSYDHFKVIRRSLSSKSSLLTGLVRLEFNFNKFYSFIHATNEDLIIQMLTELHSLKYLSLIVYSDMMIRCFINNCPLIEELVLDSSFVISNDTLALLPNLIHLRKITLKTKLYPSGYDIIVLNCKKIEFINCMEHSERINVSKAVKQAAQSPDVETLNLKSYSMYEDTAEEFKMILLTCPLIQNLVICQTLTPMFNNADIITALKSLEGLRQMTLWMRNINEPTMFVLKEVGHKIEFLTCVGSNEIDLNSIIEISNMCPNLQSFHLIQQNYIRMQRSGNRKYKEISPLVNLRNLILKVEHPTITAQELELVYEPIIVLLSNCPNVEFIEVQMPNWLTEDAMLSILKKNPLKYLRKFTIVYSHGETSTLVLKKIIKNCINQPEVSEFI